ncbi:Lrp/AsnC family transcriptional regulator [Algirhabdus cladophorae]|uniref:Lrp/AsnC family transcriptional regulator n=1 Tax=Algirhabdus cladophorae TaxID=3377108 RepID=UPI003B847F72
MDVTYDALDAKILRNLQQDAQQTVDHLGQKIGLSRNAVWRRVKRLEDSGIIRARVAVLDAEALGLGLSVFISIKTAQHDAKWAAAFLKTVRALPEIQGAYRTSGEQDYLLQARVRDVKAYDHLYQRLIAQVDLQDVSASFVMEELKETTVLPV